MYRYGLLLLALLGMFCQSCSRDALAQRRSRQRGVRGAYSFAAPYINTYSVDLDGTNDRVEIADASWQYSASKVSAFMRIKADSDDGINILLSKWNHTGNEKEFIFDSSPDHGLRVFACDTITCSGSRSCVSSTDLYGDGEWHTVGFTLDLTQGTAAEQCKIFFDGADVTVTPFAGTITDLPDSNSDLTVGGRMDSQDTTRQWDGHVDDVVVAFGDAWDYEKHLELHNNRKALNVNKISGLNADVWWEMGDSDGGTGTTVTDKSNNGRDGTLASGAAFAADVSSQYLAASSCSSTDSTRQIFMLMGQSNMSGRDTSPTATLPGNETDMYVYHNDGNTYQHGSANWDETVSTDDSTGSIYAVSNDAGSEGFAAARSMADDILDTWTNNEIGLIPCPLGGSEVDEWIPGTATNTLFGSCLSRANSADADGDIGGIIVYQGESNAQNAEEAFQHKQVWRIIHERLRSEFNDCIPMIMVELPDTVPTPAGSYSTWATIKTNVQQLSGEWADIHYVEAPDGDWIEAANLHLDTEAQEVLGPLLATKYLTSRYAGQVTP